MASPNLFHGSLPFELGEDLRSLNPHWQGKPGPQVPAFRRWIFPRLLRLLTSGLTPATVLRGPRRVGKTVLLRQIMEQFLADGVTPHRILYVPFDEIESLGEIKDPVLTIARWFEQSILKRTFNELAREGGTAYLLLDDVQNLDAWAPQIKHLLDNHQARALIACRFSHRIEADLVRLAGRITTVDVGPLTPSEIGDLRTLENDA